MVRSRITPLTTWSKKKFPVAGAVALCIRMQHPEHRNAEGAQLPGEGIDGRHDGACPGTSAGEPGAQNVSCLSITKRALRLVLSVSN